MADHNITQLIFKLEERINRIQTGADVAWINSSGYLFFFMQAGFCLVESGCARHKHHIHTLLLQLMSAIGSVFGWWIFGYAFAYGTDHSNFLGMTWFAGQQLENPYSLANWIFDMATCATCATIATGAIIERIIAFTYFIFSLLMAAWIYPIVCKIKIFLILVHWCWHQDGWLKKLGYIDHAGSGVVHITGGAAALASCLIIGPRLFRFPNSNETEEDKRKRNAYNHSNFEGNFIPFTVTGTVLIWYCWYGSNCGSTHGIVSIDGIDHSANVGIVGINTTIATVSGGITTLVIHYFLTKAFGLNHKRYNIGLLCNGLLSGTVAVTAACINIYPYGASVIGFIGGITYYFYQWLFQKLCIDDPLHAGPIHLGAGLWGVLAVGVFDKNKGFLYGGGGYQLGIQMLGNVCIFVWSFFHTAIFFYLFKIFKLLRISEEEEIKGADIMSCGGSLFLNLDEESLRYYGKLFNEFKPLKINEAELNSKVGIDYGSVVDKIIDKKD